ncbi:MAG: hypothetical protein ACOC5T_07540, partial [Elusimicrobiota bacterium]
MARPYQINNKKDKDKDRPYQIDTGGSVERPYKLPEKEEEDSPLSWESVSSNLPYSEDRYTPPLISPETADMEKEEERDDVTFGETIEHFPSALGETIKGIGEKTRWAAIFSAETLSDIETKGVEKFVGEEEAEAFEETKEQYSPFEKLIREKPEEVEKFANDYERVVGPFHRTAYPTKIPLAVGEKLVGKKLTKSYEELKEKHPVSTAISGMFGDIANISLLYQFTGGLDTAVSNKISGPTKNLAPFLTRYAPKALEYGATWGAKGFLDEALGKFEKGNFNPKKIGTETGKEFLFGTLLATPLVMKSVPKQVAGMGAMRAGWTALEGYLEDGTFDKNDAMNTAASGIVGMFFGALGAKSRVRDIAQKETYNIAHQQAVQKAGGNEAAVNAIEQTQLAQNLIKYGG